MSSSDDAKRGSDAGGVTAGRLAVALLAAALVVASLLALAFHDERERSAREGIERSAVIALRALAEVVERAGATGEGARAAVAAWAAAGGGPAGLRLVDLEARSLEYSARREDAVAGAPPRRLGRDEKALFDLAQSLRAAADTNREEGQPREDEIAVEPAGDRLRVAVPVRREGRIVAMLQAETAPIAAPRGAFVEVLRDLALPIAPAIVLLLLLRRRAGALRRWRWAAFGVGVFVLAVGVGLAGRRAEREFAARRAGQESRLGEELRAATERGVEALRAHGLEPVPPLDPRSWDADRFGRPRRWLRVDGAPDPAVLDAERAAWLAWARRVVVPSTLLGLLVYLFVGVGGAARSWRLVVRHHVAYAYAVPALLGMLVLVFFPFFYGIALSFTNSNIYNTDKSLREIWVGLDNYRDILGDLDIREPGDGERRYDYRNFYWTLLFTVGWTVSNVTIGVTLGLALALALNVRGLRGRSVYRVLLILPWAVPNYITALVWKGMFHQQFGVINQVVQVFGGAPVSWFDRPLASFTTVLATNGWLSFPFMMVISLGALQSIPADLYEAARVDGASRWQQFGRITLPLLKPALVPAIILSVIWTFNMFNIIYLVSQGEPAGSTEILITQAYKIAFEQYRYGYAAAYSTVIFVILLAYGTWQNRVTRAVEGI